MHVPRILPALGAFALVAYLTVSLTPVMSWLAEATWKTPASVLEGSGAPTPRPKQGPPGAGTELEGATTPAEPTEAIVVLASTLDPEGNLDHRSLARTVEGIRLFRAGWAPLLVLSGSTFASPGSGGPPSMPRPLVRPGMEAQGKPIGPDSPPNAAPAKEALLRAAFGGESGPMGLP